MKLVSPSKTYVVLKTTTDSTGHVDVSVVDIFFESTPEGLTAEQTAHRLKDRLNRRPKRDPMEVYIVRVAGEEGGPIEE